ncbi:MAG TPA: hypothetical protein VEC01_06225 [Noviherbaspirillum sp.]|uniref:hypothetical protein n=1 Tax=Noviherbaspirillum sp. TaxID=1926288 RepID=UPI002D418C63|nr:hypothetical protein [Noviherbaspirillum sp.]HYD94903.1 hypothetical protein [Noviherbaspirillum sp.]
MKTTITCALMIAALWSQAGHAAAPKPAPRDNQIQKEVQKDLESIVSACEKKKLPTEEEIKCIEKGYKRFMGEDDTEGS